MDFDTLTISRSINRVLDVSVEAYVSAIANYDNTLDTIAVEVEEALAANVTLDSKSKDVQSSVCLRLIFRVTANSRWPWVSFTVSVQYRTAENDVGTAA